MEQVKRYNGIEEDPEGAYVYYDDHARCVQDCRRMARFVQHAIELKLIKEQDFERLCLEHPRWNDAQAVLDRWPEVTNG